MLVSKSLYIYVCTSIVRASIKEKDLPTFVTTIND